ncbi:MULTISPECIES: helix-turn-helix domain-containing protein [Paenibacillus]|uniref:Helix-turn-helix transcriptional regulator n=1 Tax=Paenibacillus vandeheii TaxID=3035917 RepID=A0ABT8JFV6_9BACL|nr:MULTISPECIES: helix-turn-helix transcriptional regulator [Paenibacillus]KGP77807.1 hypothetical protein P364_0131615 [Paenibacillus sp. MAEPY2]KGP77928.1 hypothetical protein P363_0132820 [Paenibacillus sp. MAEPY1]MDN4603957.1 helix-turn-helix transcriptional regulator [Paenibacillus vandeheii]
MELNNRTAFPLGKGISKPRFRKATKNTIKNRILMASLFSQNIKLSDLARSIGVSKRTVHNWIYIGEPNSSNQEKIANVLGIPAQILFFEHVGVEGVQIPFQTKVHQGVLGERIVNPLLLGMMFVHEINHPDLAEYLGHNRSLFRPHIHEGRIPPQDIQDKVCTFFRLPPHILYNEALFRDIQFTAKEFRPSRRRLLQ